MALFGLGGMLDHVQKVAACLQKMGIDATVVNPIFASTLDSEFLSALTENHQLIATFEDGVLDGGFGQKNCIFLWQSINQSLKFWSSQRV